MRFKKRAPGFLLALICVAGLGIGAVKIAWQDGAPLWWILRGRHFNRVLVRWNGQSMNSRDSKVIARFENALRRSDNAMAGAMRCLPDSREDWDKWSVTLYDSKSRHFKVNVGLDSCGSFYAPSVDTTYTSHPDLISLINETLGRARAASPFQ